MTTVEREELLCSKYSIVNNFLASHGVKKEDREDLLHEVFIKALRSLKHLQAPEKIDGWLWAITQNTVKAYYSRQKREEQRSILMEEKDLEVHASKVNEGDYSKMIRELSYFADRDAIATALRTLNHRTFVIFRLYYFLGYPLMEVSEMTGINYNLVKSLHLRGLKKLRAILCEEDDCHYG